MQNVLVSLFDVQSEAYQAFSEFKEFRQSEDTLIAQAALVKKENGAINVIEIFDPIEDGDSGMLTGGLIGGLIGMIGGPLGMLIGGSFGAIVGNANESPESLREAMIIETVAKKLLDGDVAILALVQETNEMILNRLFDQYHTQVLRWNAALVKQELENAIEIQVALAIQAEEELAAKRAKEDDAKIEEFKANIKKKFDELAEKIKHVFD
ncbi:DUF1269 domain-containing protein [Glaesserella sp.]|uniref:DUF1269 domain-containing protein n=1 Tax=Glaesserella sp. TaxID=2094731 RepID=UPI0035A132D8